jgi:hypothetical protein
VASYLDSHWDQSRPARKGDAREAERSRSRLSHSLPRHPWQPHADWAAAGEAPSDLELEALVLG